MSPKALAVAGLLALTSSRLTTCRSPGEGGGDATQPQSQKTVEITAAAASALTARERTEWSDEVSHLLWPCSDQAVPLAQCVSQNRPCRACAPAVRRACEQIQPGK